MVILRSPADLFQIANLHLLSLVSVRVQQLGQIDDGLLIVVEAGDSVEEAEEACGLPILHDPYADVPLGHPDYSPPFDYIEAHYANGNVACFEAHADTGDDGIGTTLFVPVAEGIPSSLLDMFAKNAIAATS